jgi:lauroyl/myristoyl acyltransferase
MNQSLLRVLQKIPGFPQLAKRIPPIWYFRATLWCVHLSSWLSPGQRRRSRHFSQVLRGSLDDKVLPAKIRRYLFHMRLSKDLEITWNNWHHRHRDWISIEGESYLQAALQQGRGAFLISPHNFGFSKLVAPALATRGYRVHRGGNGGKRGSTKRERWGEGFQFTWGYLNYKGDYWHRAQLLKVMLRVLAANDIIHVSPRAFQQGDEEMAVEVFGRKYFLDANWFRVFQLCDSPVLPCFAVGNDDVPINIVIHPPLQMGKARVKEFADIQTRYITELPEYGRMWKNIRLERGRW